MRYPIMTRRLSALVGAALLLSATYVTGLADPEVCVVDNETCPRPVVADDSVVNESPSLATVEDQTLAPAPALEAETPIPAVTRTIGPPTVVNPFAAVAAAAQADEVPPARLLPPDQQKLPPGPPSRYP